MNTSRTSFSDRSPSSLPQRLIEALGRLQTQKPSSITGSIYVYDLVEQRTLSASCSIVAALGYTADAIHEMDDVGLGSLIHPDDLNLVSKHYQCFTTLRADEVIMINYRMKRANGTWCWLHSQETPLVMAVDGFPLQILGIVQLMPHFLAYSQD